MKIGDGWSEKAWEGYELAKLSKPTTMIRILSVPVLGKTWLGVRILWHEYLFQCRHCGTLQVSANPSFADHDRCLRCETFPPFSPCRTCGVEPHLPAGDPGKEHIYEPERRAKRTTP